MKLPVCAPLLRSCCWRARQGQRRASSWSAACARQSVARRGRPRTERKWPRDHGDEGGRDDDHQEDREEKDEQDEEQDEEEQHDRHDHGEDR